MCNYKLHNPADLGQVFIIRYEMTNIPGYSMVRSSLFLLVLAFISCNQPRYIYNQHARNVHFFHDKGQARIAADLVTGPSRNTGSGEGSYNQGYDFQGAYALSGQFALTGSYFSRREKDLIQVVNTNVATSDVRYKRSGWELGGSWFLPLDRSSYSFFHLDGGLGQTGSRFTDKGTFDTLGLTREYANKNLGIFLQPGIYTGRGPVAFAMGVRFQWNSFRDIRTSYTPAELQFFRLSGLNQMMTLEPYAILRFGPASLPGLRFEVQGSFCTPGKDYYVRGGFLSFGVAVNPLQIGR